MRLSMRSRRNWLRRVTLGIVTGAALILIAAALAFGIWATRTKSAAVFGRQTGLAAILSFVLAVIMACAGVLMWARKTSRISKSQKQKPQGWRIVPVDDCSVNDVRVHVSGAPGEPPPPYVERDHDFKLIDQLRAASGTGGLVLVTGGSSTGKSRSLIQCVQYVLSGWQMLIPENSSAVREAAVAGQIKPRTVIWLDDTPVERYITTNEDCLTANELRKLIKEQFPIIIVDSMWPSRFQALSALPDGSFVDVLDSSREARDVLALANEPIRVAEQFSRAERARARPLACGDERLAVALDDTQFGVTQTLAGAAAIVGRYRDAENVNPSAYGLMTAAIDARRIGYYSLLTREILQTAAPGYLSSRHLAGLSDDSEWVSKGLKYATDFRSSPGYVSPLIAESNSTNATLGYSVADYLLQYAQRHPHSTPIPVTTWDALLAYAILPADLRHIARAAENRLMYGYAERFHRAAARAAAGKTWSSLPQWLAKHNRIDELRERADSGDKDSRRRLANLLTANGAIDELRQRADYGDPDSGKQLANWLAASGEIDELRRRADSGDRYAQSWFDRRTTPDRLAKRLRAIRRNVFSRSTADRLYDTDRVDELRELADFGDPNARRRLGEWLVKKAQTGELRERADAGDAMSKRQLADWLAANGRIDELRTRADAGDTSAYVPLADWLVAHDEVDELRRRADAGSNRARWRLADWLAANGHISELRYRAEQGDVNASGRLAHWLAREGRIGELRERADAGDKNAARRLALWLYVNRHIAELRERADKGDQIAVERLVLWLAENDLLDELRKRAGDGADSAGKLLAEKLYTAEQIDELRALAEEGSPYANSRLIDWLASRNFIEEMRALAVVGNSVAAKRLIELASNDRFEGASQLVEYGLNVDGTIAGKPS